jgi:hypothetical protein
MVVVLKQSTPVQNCILYLYRKVNLDYFCIHVVNLNQILKSGTFIMQSSDVILLSNWLKAQIETDQRIYWPCFPYEVNCSKCPSNLNLSKVLMVIVFVSSINQTFALDYFAENVSPFNLPEFNLRRRLSGVAASTVIGFNKLFYLLKLITSPQFSQLSVLSVASSYLVSFF